MFRFERNIGSITEEEQLQLLKKRVCVIGCGGLGGYVIEMLARIGVGYLTIVDGDTFSENNLNRQLCSSVSNIGKSKVIETAKHFKYALPDVDINAVKVFLDEKNAVSIISGHDIVIDGLDNASTRVTLERACEIANVVLIHAAVAEWKIQISTIYPGDRTLSKMYHNDASYPTPSVLSFVPPMAASYEVCEAIKVLLNKGTIYRNKLLVADLLNNTTDYIET